MREEICILHTNDIHSQLENFAKKSWLINKIKAEQPSGTNLFLFDSGDVFSGSLYFTLFQGQKEAQLMNALGYDGMTLGNHEFDQNSKILADFIHQLKYPILTSNIDFQKDELLAGNPNIHPYLIKHLNNGSRLAIFGLTTLTTTETAAPNPNIDFKNPFLVAEKMLEQFRRLKVDIVVLLSHLGIETDMELAKSVPGINVILGAHTHTVLKEPMVIGKTIINQAGSNGEFLGRIELELSENGIEIKSQQLYAVDEITEEDPKVKAQIDAMKLEKIAVASAYIAEVGSDLNGQRETLHQFQSNLGNLIADAYFEEAKVQGFAPDMAIMNGGGIRTSLKKGSIYYENLLQVLPFSKTLMLLETTGEQIFEALANGLYPQVSNLKVHYDHTRPTGSQLVEVLVGGVPLDRQKTYRVATNSFVGIGKDDYIGFKKAKILKETTIQDVELLANFLKRQLQPINYPFEQRVFN